MCQEQNQSSTLLHTCVFFSLIFYMLYLSFASAQADGPLENSLPKEHQLASLMLCYVMMLKMMTILIGALTPATLQNK